MNPADRYAPAQVFTLGNAAGLRVAVMDYGATWLSCTLPLPDGGRRELLLGCADLAEYQRQTYYIGATIGRFTNRIRDSRFVLDGQEVLLLPNEGEHQLHGGPDSFDRRFWQLEFHDERRVRLGLVSPDGDQGYPGELHASVSYALGDDLSLTVSFEARCSAPCPVGLTHHAYFNLDGDQGGATPSVLQHRLRVAADQWLPVDAQMQATAELAPVDGSGFDLRGGRQLAEAIRADPVLRGGEGFDHSLALEAAVASAELSSSDGRVRMQLSTDQPALQVFTGQGLGKVRARDGQPYPAHAGIALEPQFHPGSPRHAPHPPQWPDCILRPGHSWRSQSRFQFFVD